MKVSRTDLSNGKKKIWQSHRENSGWERGGYPDQLLPFRYEEWHKQKHRLLIHVEGEKCVNDLNERGYIATTSPGGASAWNESYAPYYAEMNLVILCDNDRAGKTYAQQVYNSTRSYTKSSKIVELPDLDEGEACYDWSRKEGNTEEKFKQLLRESPHRDVGDLSVEQDLKIAGNEESGPFICNEHGVFMTTPDGEQKKISSRIEIASALRDQNSQGWSRSLIVTDPDGVCHTWLMPMTYLAGDGRQVIEKLLDLGATIESKTKGQLLQYLQTTPTSKSRCSKHLGWNRESFVFPDESIQAEGKEAVQFQSESAADHRFYQKGSLQEWVDNVATLCSDNSKYVFGLSVGFASILLELVSEESFGINLHGSSSKGKTTLLTVAGSIFGGGERGKYVRSWRTTGNALESVVALHNSTLLCLDEMGQVDPTEAGEIAYMIANGVGKTRGNRTGGSRKPHCWRMIYLSSAEITLREHMNAAGKKSKAGQEIRMLDIPIESSEAVQLPPNFKSEAALADHLREATNKYFGVASREFIRKLVTDREVIIPQLSELISGFCSTHTSDANSGQVSRVVKKFGLIGAAGELATSFGILPFPDGQCTLAAQKCFSSWLKSWGTSDREALNGLDQIRDFLNTHGESRFVQINASESRDDNRENVFNKAGYRQTRFDATGSPRVAFFWVTPSAFAEMIRGCNRASVLKHLCTCKYLIEGSDKACAQRRDPLTGQNQRFYILSASLLEGENGAI